MSTIVASGEEPVDLGTGWKEPEDLEGIDWKELIRAALVCWILTAIMSERLYTRVSLEGIDVCRQENADVNLDV